MNKHVAFLGMGKGWRVTVCLFYLMIILVCVQTDLGECALMTTGRPVAEGTMTKYLTQSAYHDAVLTSPCIILLILSVKVGSDKCQFSKLLL